MPKRNDLIHKVQDQVVSTTLIEILTSVPTLAPLDNYENNNLKRSEALGLTAVTKDANGVNFEVQATPDIEGHGVADSYAVANQDILETLDDTNFGVGQTITGDGGKLRVVRFYLSKTLLPVGDIVAKIYAISGAHGSTGVPTGAALATSRPVKAEDVPGSLALVSFFFDKPFNGDYFTLVDTTNYVITIEYADGDASNFVNVGQDSSTPGHGGNAALLTGSWAAVAGSDTIFFVDRSGIRVWAAVQGYKQADAQMQAVGNSGIAIEIPMPAQAYRIMAIRSGGADGLVDASITARNVD